MDKATQVGEGGTGATGLRQRASTLLPIQARDHAHSAADGAGNFNILACILAILLLVLASPSSDTLCAD
ncbi:hypothetical protein NUW54_g13252 [Trametes sanguinea]|uniref:Uncharacterized protein n=1 Tax=Trametes sanguinea TaxID=158606 RepID=A0ACC1MP62_9APHY|nr:hypothetical protein NUW54_g13252 [Trametes sanguinea]